MPSLSPVLTPASFIGGSANLPGRVAEFEQQLLGRAGRGVPGSSPAFSLGGNLGGNFGGLSLGENSVASLTGLAMIANGRLEGMAGQLLLMSAGQAPARSPQPADVTLQGVVSELGEIAQELAKVASALGAQQQVQAQQVQAQGTPGAPGAPQQAFDGYVSQLGAEGRAALLQGQKVAVALRGGSSGSGHGDQVAVLWQDGGGGHVQTFRADLPAGQLADGTYALDQAAPGGGAGSAGRPGDAAGQMLPPGELQRFRALTGSQPSMVYELRTLGTAGTGTGGGPGGMPAPGGGGPSIAGLTPGGLEFIYRHEHEDGKMVDHPSPNSGVTIGAGYDMKEKNRDQVRRDLLNAGASAAQADVLVGAVGLSGGAADEFVRANKHLLDGMGKDFELRLIKPELEECAAAVDKASGGKLAPRQRDAVISYVLTVGTGGFEGSAACAALKRGDIAGVAQGLRGGPKGDGSGTLQGLRRRREEEAALFES